MTNALTRLADRVLNRRPQTAATNPPADNSPGGGKSPAELVRGANRWRDNYNPLRSLVIARVVAILEAAERGDFAELQLVMRKVERRYPVLKGLKARRLAALEKLDWDIKTTDLEKLPPGATKEMAEAQQNFLRTRYDLIENLTEAFGQLVTPEFRGYAILQKHRYQSGDGGVAATNDGAVRELHWLPQDQFSRDGQFGDFYYNQDSRFGIGGDGCQATLGEKNRIGSDDLPREEFIIRESDAPLYEIALIAFVNWAMGRKDHAAFVEIFGLPNSVVIMPPNIPPGKEEEYRSAAEKVADGVSGAVPSGSDVKFPTASVRGNAPFKEYCDAQDADVVLAGTSGLLTMLSLPTGIGQGASGEHGDAFDDLAQADARKINATLQRDFDALELAAEFPGQPRLAYFELCAVEEEDATAIVDRVQKLENVGLEVDPAEVSEKIGLKLTRGVAATPPSPGEDGRLKMEDGGPITNRDAATATLEQGFIAAIANKTDPVLALLNRITDIEDDAQMIATLNAFYAHADRITAAVTADATKVARALEQITAPALEKGLAGK